MSLTNNGHALANLYTSAYYTYAQPLYFNVDTLVTGIGFYAATGYSSTSNLQAYLWSSSRVLLASSNLSSSVNIYDQPYSPLPTIIKFTTPYLCLANTTYYFGGYQRYASFYSDNTNHATHSVGTVDGVSVGAPNATNARYVESGNTTNLVNSTSSYEWQMAIEFDNTKPPLSPTGVSVAGSVAMGGNPVVSWTHNDTESEPQAGYQIRWRKA